MPAVRGEVAAAAVGDKLFALGGGVAGKAVARNEDEQAMIATGPIPDVHWHADCAGVRISMDGRGRWMDKVFIERMALAQTRGHLPEGLS